MVIGEGILLLLVTPALLMPETWPMATAAALLALAIAWIISLIFAPPPSTPFNLAFILWGVALSIGILATADPAETLPKATGLILGLAVWRYLVIALYTRRQVAPAVILFLLIGLSLSLVGIFGLQELPKIPALAAVNPFSAQTLPGLGGLAIHPNQLAGLICLYLPLLVSLLFAPPRPSARRLKILLIPATALATVILVLTQSRGGWIGAAAGLYALLVLWSLALPPSGRRRFLRGAGVVGLLAGVAAAAWIGPDRLRDLWLNPPKETAVGTLTTLNYRRELWPWAVTAVQDFPFTGVGLGAFRHVAFRLYPMPMTPAQDIGHAHNIFLQTALDVGIPGLIVYLAILLVAAAAGWRVARRDEKFRPLSLGLLAGLVAVHVFGLADALALGSKPALLFWFALGLLAAMNNRVQAADQ